MNRLSSQKILEENGSHYPASIINLKLNHKALSDVSCLSGFKNLERLDLSFNNLSSLEDLRSCVNLKWLSVSENKLQSLRGIENLTKLTVLNASRNKLKSMDEVRSITSLRALILNDNQISSMCRLDQLGDLNTIVLSRNPILDIGDSLVKLKSITKLSLSNCQLQNIGSSLSHLLNLKEFRLSHNEITTLPADLAHNVRLQNLDLGNNSITRFSDLKVLSSLRNLKNLNLHGNPVAEKDELAKKIKKLIPDLQIFNSRPIERSKKNENSKIASDSDTLDKVRALKEKKVKRKNSSSSEKISTTPKLSQKEDNPFDKAETCDVERREKHKLAKINMEAKKDVSSGSEDDIEVKKYLNRQKKKVPDKGKRDPIGDDKVETCDVERRKNHKLAKTNMEAKKDVSSGSEDDIEVKKDLNRQKKKVPDKRKLDPIGDEEILFTELIGGEAGKLGDGYAKKIDQAAVQDVKSHGGGIVTLPAKRKKGSKNLVPHQFLSPEIEVGMGGPSMWDD